MVDANGAPVEGATVRLTERTLLVAQPRGTATTDASGHFVFTGHQLHHLFLEASKEGAGKAAPVEFRLYFKGENLDASPAVAAFRRKRLMSEGGERPLVIFDPFPRSRELIFTKEMWAAARRRGARRRA